MFGRQLAWVGLGLAAMFLFSRFDYRRFYGLAFIFYGLSIVFLFVVLVFGRSRFGAQRWLDVFGLNFQPSELGKFSLVLLLARYYSEQGSSQVSWRIQQLGLWRSLIFPGILVAVPFALILHQPDLGTAIICGFIFLSLAFVAGVNKRQLFFLCALAGLALPALWHLLRPYQKDRLLVFLNPNIDPLGAGYTIIQSKIAVGSGRLFGQGWLSGAQNRLDFLPERHTDFIFSCLAESCGFLGAVVLLLLFWLLLRECIRVIYSTRDPFARLLVSGIVAVISFQVLVNISMTIGLMPVVGIPLPLVSYGGTSTLITFMSIGIVMSIAKNRVVF